jgi:hypothetical protein
MSDPTFRGHTIFCDDIRNEVDGKVSFIGCYHGIMYVNADFPFLIAKFGLAITYMEKMGAYDGDVRLRIYFPGDEDDKPSFEGLMPIQDARNAPLNPNPDPSETIYRSIGTNFILSPLVVAKEGLIKVRAYCGDNVVKLGALRVVKGVHAPVESATS